MLVPAPVRDRLDLYRYYRRDAGYVRTAENDGAAVLDLATVSFNSALVVRHQAKLLKNYLQDEYSYTVFDNSPPGPPRQEIRAL